MSVLCILYALANLLPSSVRSFPRSLQIVAQIFVSTLSYRALEKYITQNLSSRFVSLCHPSPGCVSVISRRCKAIEPAAKS